jgi:thiamine biosynthesis lipoprotein
MPVGAASAGVRVAVAALVAVAFACVGCSPQPTAATLTPYEYQRIIMGAPCRLVIHAVDETTADDAAQAAFARMGTMEEALSDWMPQSEVRRLPAAAGAVTPVGADLGAALEASLRWNALTNGAFDPTVGALTKLWRTARRAGQVPSTADSAAARARCGAPHVRFDPRTRTYAADIDGLELDFGGIGQGMAADAALAVLRARGISSALVDLSGDIAVGDAPPGRDAWRVELDDPWHTVLLLENAAVTTSGDRFQHLDVATGAAQPARLSHIIDPATGEPLRNRVEVTAVARTATDADALATSLCVMGPARGRALLEHAPNASARWRMEGDGDAVTASVGWPRPAR